MIVLQYDMLMIGCVLLYHKDAVGESGIYPMYQSTRGQSIF